MDYFSYRKFFDEKLSRLKLPKDCVLQEPSWEITAPPYFWTLEAFFRFDDGKHIRIWESYEKFSRIQESRRIQWSYHYGPTQSISEDGKITQGSADDPVDIRIDTCSGLHLHYQKREPHYDQNCISGLELETIDVWNFVKAVFKHRKTGQQFTKILGFRIV